MQHTCVKELHYILRHYSHQSHSGHFTNVNNKQKSKPIHNKGVYKSEPETSMIRNETSSSLPTDARVISTQVALLKG